MADGPTDGPRNGNETAHGACLVCKKDIRPKCIIVEVPHKAPERTGVEMAFDYVDHCSTSCEMSDVSSEHYEANSPSCGTAFISGH